jgi:flagellar basal body-associated protein FliL
MSAGVADDPKTHSDHEPSALPRASSRKKMLIGVIVTLVVVVQAVVTWLLLPHSASTDAAHKPPEKEQAAAAPPELEHEVESHEGDVAEVAMGDFSFSNGTAMPGSIIHVDFKLAAVTSAKQAASLEAQIKQHSARIRQAVNRIVRGSNLEELNDPNLHAIKRSIREEINRLLRKSYVNEVVITDVRTMEQ